MWPEQCVPDRPSLGMRIQYKREVKSRSVRACVCSKDSWSEVIAEYIRAAPGPSQGNVPSRGENGRGITQGTNYTFLSSMP